MPKDPTADKPIEPTLYRQLVFDGIVNKVNKVRISIYRVVPLLRSGDGQARGRADAIKGGR